MKIVNIAGGLGNQMFQYAFACYLKHQFPNEEVLLDTHHFAHYNLHNGYELNRVFPNLSIPIATKEQVKKMTRYIPHYKLSRLARKLLPVMKTEYVEHCNYSFDEKAGAQQGDCYYEGYWQAMPYYISIREQLLQEFTFPTPCVYNVAKAKEIKNGRSVGIHIRRGDYLKLPDFQGVCDIDYYQRAIEMLLTNNSNYTFYIFSNDIEWCRENIEPLLSDSSVSYVDFNQGANSCWDIYLMSQCENLIIANSSFSWWGAFLNQHAKCIIAPNKWVNRNQNIEVYDPSWIVC